MVFARPRKLCRATAQQGYMHSANASPLLLLSPFVSLGRLIVPRSAPPLRCASCLGFTLHQCGHATWSALIPRIYLVRLRFALAGCLGVPFHFQPSPTSLRFAVGLTGIASACLGGGLRL